MAGAEGVCAASGITSLPLVSTVTSCRLRMGRNHLGSLPMLGPYPSRCCSESPVGFRDVNFEESCPWTQTRRGVLASLWLAILSCQVRLCAHRSAPSHLFPPDLLSLEPHGALAGRR